MSLPIRSNNLLIQGRRIHLWTGGSGPAVLLLHSAWGDAELSWSPVWNDLAKTFTVIAPDMPGFGRSGPFAPISLGESVRILAGLLDHHSLDRVVLVGNSFGVALAVEFALTFSDRTAHLVVVNGGYLPHIPVFVKKLISIPAIEKRFRAFMRKMVYSDKAFANAFPNMQLLPPGFFESIRKHEEQHSRVVADAFMLQGVAQSSPQVPTTIIWGTGDRLVSPRQAERIQKWFHDPGMVLLNGAGHMPQVEQPREFVEIVRNIKGKW